MENIVYSYGGGEALFKVLLGVKMIFDHEVTKSLLHLMTFVGLAWAGFQGAQQNSWTPKLSWLAKYVLITSMFITPTTTIWVTDVVYNKRDKIDGLPIGLVLPASIFSGLGFGITQLFDQAFAKVDDNLAYTKYGQNFGAALISQARNFKIQDSVFRENMENFIDNCMLYDVMIGRKYNATELRDSTRIWELVSKGASNIRMMNYRDSDKSVKRKLVTCRDGVGLLNNYWNKDIDKLGEKFGSTIFGKYAGTTTQGKGFDNQEILGKSFSANIEAVSQLYGKNTGSATETLKQVMIINAISDIPMSYGAVRAKQQQQESWLISGQLAQEILPTLHAVFAALIYASFTLIIGMLVLPNGFRTLANYLGLMIWIETWPPLFAVLNLLSNISSKTYGGNFNAITMNNISQIVSHNNNISVVASGMMMVLPYLSYNILKGGAGQFVHLASQVMGASQSAAQAASSEVTSGNRSLDNISMLNGQWSNNSGFKTDMNASFRSGHRDHQLSDGTIMKEAPDGRAILHSGPGITTSVGAKSMHMATSNSYQTHQSLSNEKAHLTTLQSEREELEQTTHRLSAELVDRLATGEASGEHYSYNRSTAAGKTLNSSIANSKELQDSYSYNKNQASEIAIKGNLGGSFSKSSGANANTSGETVPQGLWNKITGGYGISVNAGLDLNASGRVEDIDSQELSENKSASTNSNITQQDEDIIRAAKEINFSNTQSQEKALANSLSGSYEKLQQKRDAIRVSEEKIQKYQISSDSSQSHSLTVSDDMYGKQLDFIAAQRDQTGFKIGLKAAAQIIENNGSDFNKYHKAFFASSLSHQQVQSPDFNFTRLKTANIDQDINLEKNYNKVMSEGNAVMNSSNANVNQEAKIMVDQQQQIIPGKIEQEEHKIVQKGEKLQKTANKTEEKRLSTALFGRKKDENTNFIE